MHYSLLPRMGWSSSPTFLQGHPGSNQDKAGVRTAAIVVLMLLPFVVFVIGGFAGWIYAGTKSSTSASSTSPSGATALQTQMESVATKVKPSIVVVYVILPNNKAAIGSGVIADSRG